MSTRAAGRRRSILVAVRDGIHRRLAPELEQHGSRFVRRDEAYRQDDGGVRSEFCLGIASRPPALGGVGILVEPALMISVPAWMDDAERRIANEADGWLAAETPSCAVWELLDSLVPGNRPHWTLPDIPTDRDITVLADMLHTSVAEVAVPFYVRLRTPEHVLHAIEAGDIRLLDQARFTVACGVMRDGRRDLASALIAPMGTARRRHLATRAGTAIGMSNRERALGRFLIKRDDVGGCRGVVTGHASESSARCRRSRRIVAAEVEQRLRSTRARLVVMAIGASIVTGCAPDPVPSVPAIRASPTPVTSQTSQPAGAPTDRPTPTPTPTPIASQAFPAGFPRDAIWFGRGWATTLDRVHRVQLSDAERPLATWGGLFVTVERLPRRASRIRVRDMRTDEVLQVVRMDEQVTAAVIAGDGAYLTGDLVTGSSLASTGLLRLSISDGSIRRVVTPRPDTILVSARGASGRFIALQRIPIDDVGRPTGLSAIDIHRVGGRTRRDVVPATETNVMAAGDDLVITRDERQVRAYAVADGRRAWQLEVGGTLPGYVTPDGTRLIQPLFLEDEEGEGWVVAVIDMATGAILIEHRIDVDVPWASISNDRFLLFGSENSGTYRSLDLESGLVAEWPVPS